MPKWPRKVDHLGKVRAKGPVLALIGLLSTRRVSSAFDSIEGLAHEVINANMDTFSARTESL